MKSIQSCFICAFTLLLTSCSVGYKTSSFISKTPSKIDYSSKKHWAVFDGIDANGSIIGNEEDRLTADVFFVYPTLLTNKKDIRWNAPINDSIINSDVLKWVVPYQATAWADAGSLYVPYYRQNHYRAFFEPYLNEGGLAAQKAAYNDIKGAFEYYLSNVNKGRPIILAGHSQGAIHLKKLLQEFFDGKKLQSQLVAAYLVGARVLTNEFDSLKPLTSPTETGGYVSWNSFKKGKFPKYYSWFKNSVTTNPITWDDSKTTLLSQHKGLMYYDNELFPKSLDVEVKDGLLWVSLPEVPKRFWFSFLKDYHRFDISLFWQDINENAIQRVRAFN